ALAVERRDLERDRRRARRDDDVVRRDRLGLAVDRDLDAITGQELAAPLDRRDARRLEHGLDAARQLLDDPALALEHCRDVDAERADLDAVRRELRRRAVIELRRLEQ